MRVNTVTLGGKYALHPPQPDYVNWFASSTGAGRYGHGVFLLATEDYDTLAAAAGTVDLVIGDHRAAKQLTIPVYVASATPYITKAGTGLPGVMSVRVYDKRYAQDALVTRAYNVQKARFTYTSDAPDFIDATLNSSAEWTWPLLVDNIELPALPNPPAWKPRNVVFDAWQTHRVIDWVAASVYVVVGYDYAASKVTFNVPGTMNGANTGLLAAARTTGLLADGGEGKRNANRLPGRINCIFKGNYADDAALPFTQRTKTRIVTVGPNTGHTQPLQVGTHIATYTAGAWKESAALDAVADDLAPRAYAFISVPPFMYEVNGIVPFSPDGAIREIFWWASKAGAVTKISGGVRFDWAQSANGGLWGFADPGMPGPMPRLEFPSDQLIVGLDGLNSSVDPAGTRRVWGGGGNFVRGHVVGSTGMGGGFYLGKLVGSPGAPIDPTVDLTAAVLGADGADCILMNVQELGAAAGSHWLTAAGNTAQTYFTGVVVGTSTTGKPVVQINAVWVKKCG